MNKKATTQSYRMFYQPSSSARSSGCIGPFLLAGDRNGASNDARQIAASHKRQQAMH